MATSDSRTAKQVVAPRSWKQCILSIGPGFFVAMAWLGTGDLVDNAVSGANYGYALMWALVLALVTKFFFVSALSKYQLCNSQGDDSIMQGFARVWRPLPKLLAICIGVLIFVYESYFIAGAGTALYNLSGGVGGEEYGIFIWSSAASLAAIAILLSGREYKIMEVFARVTVLILVLTFLVAAVVQRPDVGAILQGLTFDLPANEGAIGSTLLAVSIMGVVGVTPVTIIYPYAIRERGWSGPTFRRVQLLDVFIGIAAVAIIDLSIWVTSAQAMRGAGGTIDAPQDLTVMMERAVGGFGPTVLWVAVFFVTFSSMPSTAYIYSRVVEDGFRSSQKRRLVQQAKTSSGSVGLRWFAVSGLVLPLVFALPWAPNLIILTILGGAISVVAVPAFVVGILYLTSSKKMMLPGTANKWWETLILVLITLIAVWAIYGLVTSLGGTIAELAG